MIIGGDFGSDRVTFSPHHDDVDTCDDGQPCIYSYLEVSQSKDGPVQDVPPGLNCTSMNNSLAFYPFRWVNQCNYWPI